MNKMDDMQQILKVQLTDAISTAITIKGVAFGSCWSKETFWKCQDILDKLHQIEYIVNTLPQTPDEHEEPPEENVQ